MSTLRIKTMRALKQENQRLKKRLTSRSKLWFACRRRLAKEEKYRQLFKKNENFLMREIQNLKTKLSVLEPKRNHPEKLKDTENKKKD